MKKILLLLTLAAVFAVNFSIAQSAKKYVLFEHFTNACCGPCAQQNPVFQDNILKENLNNIYHIAYHPSWPCATDPMYAHNPNPIDTRVSFYGVSGVPTMYMLGNQWEGSPANVTQQMIDDAMAPGSPVEIEVTETNNTAGDGRDVNISVKTIGTIPSGTWNLKVVVVEREINYATPPGTNGETYFPNVFRSFLSSVNGDSYTPAAQGSSTDYSYSYTFHSEWAPNEIYVIAFLQNNSTKEVLNSGASIIAHSEMNFAAPNAEGKANKFTSVAGEIKSVFGDGENFKIKLKKDAPGDWLARLKIDGQTYTDSVTIALSTQSASQVYVEVAAGATPAIGNYELIVESIDYPATLASSTTINVVSNIWDVVIDNDGEGNWENVYTRGLNYAGNKFHDVVSVKDFINIHKADIFKDLHNVYLSVGWNFPPLTDELVDQLSVFLDNGGNIFMAGQDISWALWGTQSTYWTTKTRSFYTTYFQIEYIDDGTTTNSMLTPNTSDMVFGAINSSSIASVYSGFYPDEVNPLTSQASPIFYYNNSSKVAGVRVEGSTHKAIYLGVGLEMVGDTAVADEIMKISQDWFYGDINVKANENAVSAAVKHYPNPADNYLVIQLPENLQQAEVEILDVTGKTVKAFTIEAGKQLNKLPINELKAGVYFYQINVGSDIITSNRFAVIH